MKSITYIGFAWVLCSLAMADDTILREDFDNVEAGKLPAGWIADGHDWRVINGRLRGSKMDGEATIRLGPNDIRDVAISADVWFIETREDARWAAVLLRDGGPDAPGVQLTARCDATRGNGLELATRRPADSGGGWHVFQTATASQRFLAGGSHRIRIESRGEWLCAYFDDEKVFECPRGRDVGHSGQVGFRVNGSIVEFDNVLVTRTNPMTPAELRRLRPRPLVIAHRGFSNRAPENTLAAYRLAIEAGADMAECDVYLTSDRVPVLLHDDNLKRTTGLDASVSSLPLSRIMELDAGSWKSSEFTGERIPTLVETLKLVHRRLRLVIEIKSKGMEREVVAAIRDAGVDPEEVMIFSFHHDVVEKIASTEPRLPTTWLIGKMPHGESERRGKIAEALQARCTAIGLPMSRVNPFVVRLAHESGLPVFVWTVNAPADMRYLLNIGVDAIITDCPDVLIEILEEL